MEAELTGHLGYEKGDPAGNGSGNSRNGTTPKTVGTEVGDIALDQPRDRNSTFASALVPKGARRLGGLEDMIISLYAGGMTIRDIQHHLAATLGTELSHETISKVTDAVAEEVTAWQTRPLEAFYPVIYLDALVVKIRDGAHVSNRAAHIAVGVDMDGVKHVLGIWVQATEGAKFWASVCAELANRGVKDVLIVCCDGLTGFPEAIEATWSQRDGPNLRGAPDPGLDAVRVLQRPQGRRRDAQADLHRRQRGRRADRAGHVRRLQPGQEVPRRGRLVGERLGPVHPVPGVRARLAQGHLHDQQHRYLEPASGCR
jgi:transposase-like protein